MRHKQTTLTLSIRLNIPKGSNTAAILRYVRGELTKTDAVPAPYQLDRESIVVNLIKKETTYA